MTIMLTILAWTTLGYVVQMNVYAHTHTHTHTLLTLAHTQTYTYILYHIYY